MKVLHVITGLGTGGAEMMLLKLLSRLRHAAEHQVLALTGPGTVGARIEALGIPVHCLSLGDLRRGMGCHVRTVLTLARWQPTIVHGWMYHGNMAATGLWWIMGRKPALLWSIRTSLNAQQHPSQVRPVIRLGAWLSRYPSLVLYNAAPSLRQHGEIGYAGNRALVIPNGFDTDRFTTRPDAKMRLCARLGCSPDDFLIGLIARYDPTKDFPNFFAAADALSSCPLPHRFVCAGPGVDESNRELVALITKYGLQDRVALLGEVEDVAELAAGLDVACSSSRVEGFSNAIGEAMACGVPCVVTDVGESSFLVGDTGFVVPPSDAGALAGAIRNLLSLPAINRTMLGLRARARIVDRFSIDVVGRQYAEVYNRLANPVAGSLLPEVVVHHEI